MTTLESLKGSDKLREAYPKINRNFDEINQEALNLSQRLNTIITTPIDGEAAAQELVDARTSITKEKTFDTLGARFEEIEQEGGSAEKTAYDNIDSELEAENVQAAIDETVGMVKTHKADYATQSAKTYYLDQASGNDNNDGLTAITAFASWEKTAAMIPTIGRHNLTVKIVGNYTGNIILQNKIWGSGVSLLIEGNTATPSNQTITGALKIASCTGGNNSSQISIWVRQLRVTETIEVSGCINVALVTIEPRKIGGQGVRVDRSLCSFSSLNFGDGVVQDGLVASTQSIIASAITSGSCTRYGLHSSFGSVIAKQSTQPTGTTANEFTEFGGVIR